MTKSTSLNDLKQREREARKTLILDAAVILFSSNPVANVSIRDIAKQAGVSPALIYRYFEDRDELFVEAFIKYSEETIFNFNEVVLSNKEKTPENIGDLFVNFLLDNKEFFQMMTQFMMDGVLKDERVKPFNSSMRRLLEVFDRSFKNCGVAEQVRLHSQALLAAMNGIVITYRNYPGRSEEEIRKHVSRLARFVAGKLTETKPPKPL